MVEVGDYYKDNLVKQAECRKKIWEASGFLLELINEVLDMGKLESEEVILEERSYLKRFGWSLKSRQKKEEFRSLYINTE